MSSPNKRIDQDVTKLMMNGYKVEMINDRLNDINVEFHGPKDSPYEGGVWKVHVNLLDEYPYQSPSIAFVNKIFHPNIEELTGAVCLDVIDETWSPMFDLVNIFEVFLPQLLLYPNPSHPFNEEAAELMMKDKNIYEEAVKDYCELYAKGNVKDSKVEAKNSDEDVSDGKCSSDEDVAGKADP